MTSWQLTAAAQADLQDILRHTRKAWGESQARTYAAELRPTIQSLADHLGQHRTLPRLHADVRIARCGRHLIFALPRPEAPTLILALLHERMDVIAHLSHRLP